MFMLRLELVFVKSNDIVINDLLLLVSQQTVMVLMFRNDISTLRILISERKLLYTRLWRRKKTNEDRILSSKLKQEKKTYEE